jgi:hypothetical protein
MRLEYMEADDDDEMMENEGDIDFMMSNNTGGANDSADINIHEVDEIGSHTHANVVPQPSTVNKKIKRQESNPA